MGVCLSWKDDNAVPFWELTERRQGERQRQLSVRHDDERAESWTNEQFDHIVKRYKEYSQFAWDHGFRMGAENHWGPERTWAHLKKLYQAVDQPGFGISCHIRGWSGTTAEQDEADRLVAPWVCHTHFPWNITEGPLEEKMANLRDAGYKGFYSVEHHTAKDEYPEVAVQIARVRAVLDRWRVAK